MALLPYADPDTLSPEDRAPIDRFVAKYNRPTLVYSMLAWFPPAIHAIAAVDGMLWSEHRLPQWLKGVLFVASSEQRGCSYCMGGQSNYLMQEYGLSKEEVRRIRAGEADDKLTEAQHALVAFVRKVTDDPNRIGPSDVERLREHGWEPPDIVEALCMAMLAGFTNTLALSMKLEEDIAAAGLDYF